MGILALIVSLLLAIVLHEFAHAWVGNYLGDDTAAQAGRLSLNPMAHIDPFMTLLLPLLLILAHSPVIFGAARPVPFNPWAVRGGKWGAVMVALAGPATNFLIAIFFALWLRVVPSGETAKTIFITIITTNVAFGVFNMIPFPPLDGSRLLYALVPHSIRDVMDRIERSGLIGIGILLFVAFPLISPLLAWLVGHILQVLVPGLTGLSG